MISEYLMISQMYKGFTRKNSEKMFKKSPHILWVVSLYGTLCKTWSTPLPMKSIGYVHMQLVCQRLQMDKQETYQARNDGPWHVLCFHSLGMILVCIPSVCSLLVSRWCGSCLHRCEMTTNATRMRHGGARRLHNLGALRALSRHFTPFHVGQQGTSTKGFAR